MNGLAVRIDALLPQTQCTRCGYPTCRAYAEAIAVDAADIDRCPPGGAEGVAADIDRCPPGGAEGVAALAALLGRTAKPLDRAFGVEAPPTVAFIDEDTCIGCTKCIQACPVDAIVGAGKRMHTVITAECTGCQLCLPPCPVDCIVLVPTASAPLARSEVLRRASAARARFDARNQRLAKPGALTPPDPQPSIVAPRGEFADASSASSPLTRSAVLEAIARGKARRAGRTPTSR